LASALRPLQWLGALALCLSLSGCDVALLNPAGIVGQQDKEILFGALAIMLAIVIPTIVAIVACAWWFRAGNPRARYLPHLEYSGQVELVVWSIPTLTVLLLAGVIWIGSHKLDPAVPIEGTGKPVKVQVVSLDWKWLFLYPDQRIASVNRLVVPVGAPLQLELTSGSVMTVFFVPQWGSMIYTMNGMATHLNLRADRAGEYYGEAAQISGDGFSDMHFEAKAVSPDDFGKWTQGADGPAFDEAAYRDLSKQGAATAAVRPLADSSLFDDIVSQKTPPAPGPTPDVRPAPGG